MSSAESHFAGRRVLVTGASGFIGSHLCRRLLAAAADVHAVSRATRASADITWWQGDLAEPATVEHLVSLCRPDILFHLASQVAGARDASLVRPMLRDNLLSTINLLTATQPHGTRVVLAGSMEEPLAIDEPVPCSPYAAAKWAASGYARMFASLYGSDVVIARLFMVYGPAQPDEKKLVPYVIRSLLRGESPALSSGERQVDWIYIDDVVEGLIATAAADLPGGSTVDLGTGELTTVRAVAEKVGQIVDPAVPLRFGALEQRPFETVRQADTARTRFLTGWEPRLSLAVGLERTVAWYRANP